MANDDELNINMSTGSILDLIDNDELIPTEFVVEILEAPSSGSISVDMSTMEVTYTPEDRFIGEVNLVYELCSIICPDNCSQASANITVGDMNICIAPTIITPNGDGLNDIFTIPCINTGNYSNNELIVFNEWGDQVYYAQPYDNTWNGTYDGSDLPSGTYFFVFQPNSLHDAIKGFLIIQR